MIQHSHTEKRLLDSLRDARPSEESLQRCRDEERCLQLFRVILLRAARHLRNGAAVMDSVLQRSLLEVPDPERLLVHLDRLLEASFSPASVLEDFIRIPDLLPRFARMTAASQWLADTMVRDAGLFRWLLTTDVLQERPSRWTIAERARDAVGRFDRPQQRMNALRRFQRRELLRIAASDILGHKDIHQVLEELSALADAVVEHAWNEAVSTIEQRNGDPLSCAVTILALGKLGGRELNYSSDIDLMWVYDDGEHAAHERVIAAVKECIRILTESTSEGMLYRTDLRLRPDGASGTLALPLSATLGYYESRGALWERQMLLRARPCAGDAAFGESVLTALTPFVFPRTSMLLPSELAADVQKRLTERWKEDRDVKHMQGGIRQIEFSLQVLQRIHGPRQPELRTASTLESIDRLAGTGLLTLEEEALLRQAYLFLRRVEHALQLEAFEQTHTLPEREQELQRVAWVLQLDSVQAFVRKLDDTRSAVHRICRAMLGQSHEQAETASALPAAFSAEGASLRLLGDLLDGRSSRPHQRSIRTNLHQLKPQLLADLAASPLPDDALAALESLMHRATSPEAIHGLLEQEMSRRALVALSAAAPAVLRTLESDPLALELVFSGYDAAGLSAARLQRVSAVGAIASYVRGDADLDHCSARLTNTADAVLQRSLVDADRDQPPFVILAMGKYGGRELIPGSDLDVVFLYAERNADDQEKAQKLAQQLITSTQGGSSGAALYEIDARLRPEGRNAPIAVSRETWLRYYETRASLWEKQSLLRARVAAGSDALADQIRQDIDGMSRAFTLVPEAVREIRSMRSSMEPRSRFQRQDLLDIKRSAGGMVDSEFAVQLLFLAARKSDMGQTASALKQAGELFPSLRTELQRLSDTYAMLRTLQLYFRVLLDIPGNQFPADEAYRFKLARLLDFPSGEELFEDVSTRMQQNRRDFDSVCESLSFFDDTVETEERA